MGKSSRLKVHFFLARPEIQHQRSSAKFVLNTLNTQQQALTKNFQRKFSLSLLEPSQDVRLESLAL